MKIRNAILPDVRIVEPYQGTHSIRKSLLHGEPVVVKEEGKFLGIITLEDLIKLPHNLIVDSMSEKPFLDASDEILPSLLFMCQKNYDFLPVKEENEYLGVVSRRELFLDVLKQEETTSRESSTEVQVRNLREEVLIKNKFLAIIGHDIRNLFMQVLGSLEVLDKKLREGPDEKAQLMLKLARQSAEEVNAVFEGMLIWARLSTGQLPFAPQIIPLNIYVNKAVSQFQLAFRNKGLMLKNCLHEKISVFADSNMLSCILMNLIYNAIKFTPAGGEIWIDATSDDDRTEILIIDNGRGMTKSQLDGVFTVGSSERGTSDEVGTGLGLILCKEFVDRHKGSIAIESEIGSGTKVSIQFPNSRAESSSDDYETKSLRSN